MWRSEPQMPVASTRTIAELGPSSSGSGFSSTRTSPGAWKVTARIRRAAYETIARMATEPMPETEQHEAPEEDIPSQGTPEQTRLAASAMHRREHQAYGGAIQWEAAFFGWLVATGLAAILVAMAVGAGVALGLTEIDDP